MSNFFYFLGMVFVLYFLGVLVHTAIGPTGLTAVIILTILFTLVGNSNE